MYTAIHIHDFGSPLHLQNTAGEWGRKTCLGVAIIKSDGSGKRNENNITATGSLTSIVHGASPLLPLFRHEGSEADTKHSPELNSFLPTTHWTSREGM